MNTEAGKVGDSHEALKGHTGPQLSPDRSSSGFKPSSFIQEDQVKSENSRAKKSANKEVRAITASSAGNQLIDEQPDGSSGKAIQGFGFALDNLKTEALPSFVQKHQNTLTFPEKLMLMLIYIEKMCAKSGKSQDDESIGWTLGGTAFVIRDKDHAVSTWLPLFFGKAKYSSFTRKLYRWGYRKINQGASEMDRDAQAIFGNENFQRDRPQLLSNMRSVTAAKTRSELSSGAASQSIAIYDGQRMLLQPEQLMGAQRQQQLQPCNKMLWELIGQGRQQSLRPGMPQRASILDAWSSSVFPQGGLFPEQAAELSPQHQDVATTQYLLALSRLRNPVAGLTSQVQLPSSDVAGQVAGPRQLQRPTRHTAGRQQGESESERAAAVAEVLRRSGILPPSRC